jgi:ribose 5-phosphate isomerase A
MNDKQTVALYAAERIPDQSVVGLGTGSTADFFIQALADRFHHENLKLSVIASSLISSRLAQQLGLPLMGFEQLQKLDIYVDGADEVAPDGTLLKGQGSDLVKEKILAAHCDKFIVLIDASKPVKHIGEKFPIPIEVQPFAWATVKQNLEKIGAKGDLRRQGHGFALSSAGNLILDLTFPNDFSADQINQQLNIQPGVIEHGIFINLAHSILLSEDNQVRQFLPDSS